MNKIVGIFVFLMSTLVATGQVSFTAKSDALQVLEGTDVNITFTLKNAKGSNLQAPSFHGFEVLRGPYLSTSMTSVNGRSTSSTAYTYVLHAKTAGTYKVGEAAITVDGKTLKTKPLTIKVAKGKKKAPGEEKNDFMRLEVTDSSAVIGQQIRVDYVLYFQQNINSYDIVKNTEFDGFFSQQVTSPEKGTTKLIIDGEQYHRKILESITLFPQRTGTFVVDPIYVDLGIPIEGQRPRGFFSRVPTRKKRVISNKLTIRVDDLPEPQPTNFSGAVGKYRMNATIANRNVTTDDAILLNMEIRGNGDGKTISAPVQPAKPNLEYYEPNILKDENLNGGAGFIDNYKKIEYLIVPKKEGNYTIVPEFTYYDTDSNDYEILYGRATNVNVRKGSRSVTSDDRDIAIGSQMSERRTQADIVSPHMLSFADGILYGAGGLFLLALGGIFYKKKQIDLDEAIDPAEKRRRAASSLAISQLAKAKAHMEAGEGRAFFVEVSSAMNGFLGDKYQLPNTDLDKSKIERHLKRLEIEPSYIERYLAILSKCEMAIFAGQSGVSMPAVYEDSLQLIKELAM